MDFSALPRPRAFSARSISARCKRRLGDRRQPRTTGSIPQSGDRWDRGESRHRVVRRTPRRSSTGAAPSLSPIASGDARQRIVQPFDDACLEQGSQASRSRAAAPDFGNDHGGDREPHPPKRRFFQVHHHSMLTSLEADERAAIECQPRHFSRAAASSLSVIAPCSASYSSMIAMSRRCRRSRASAP